MQIKVVMLKTVTDPVCTCPVREAGLGSRILVPALPRAGEGAPRAHHVGGGHVAAKGSPPSSGSSSQLCRADPGLRGVATLPGPPASTLPGIRASG